MTTNLRQNILNQTLKNSMLDGASHSAMLGLTQNYVVPFALAFRATTAQIGLLSSIPSLIMAFSQLTAPFLARRAGSRKNFILPVALIHALIWLPILLIPYIFPGDKMWWLIGLMSLSAVFNSLANPAWGSLMADLVPENTRGRYFGQRAKICGFVTLVFSFAAGGLLQWTTGNPFIGFSVIFGSAMLFRLISWYFLSKMHEPLLSKTEKYHGNLLSAVKKMWPSNLGRFIIYVALVNFATLLCGPFFAVYMLRDLQFNYFTYVTINATASIATIAFMTFWGKRADRAGNIKVMRITAFLIPLVPVLWLVSKEVYFLIPIQILAGFAWSGFNLVSSNFLYDVSPRENRTQNIAIFNAINGLAMCLGALTGGFLVSRLPQINGSSLLTLFLISGILRGLIVLSPLRKIHEVRHVPRVSTINLMFGKHALPWAGIPNKLEPVLLPIQSVVDYIIPSMVPVPVHRSQQLAGANRGPPFFDDS
ncbi:MAG: MFS transporter [Dehalococcoidales bacterium]|nr:MFS transporter [Dehalococcoidales bacterium]